MAITCVNPEPAGELRRDRGLADPGHAAEQHHQRPLEVADVPPLAEAGQHLVGLLRRPRTSSASARSCSTSTSPGPLRRRAGPRSARASANERSGAQPRGHERLRHQPLRVGQPVAAADPDDRACGAPGLIAPRTPASAQGAGAGRRAARPRAPPAGCAGTRPARPPAPRASATISIAAAFSSVRKTSQPVAQRLPRRRARGRGGGRGSPDHAARLHAAAGKRRALAALCVAAARS